MRGDRGTWHWFLRARSRAKFTEHFGDAKAVFIDLPQTSHLGYAAQFQARADAAGKQAVQLPGDIRLIENLINGAWDEEEYLVVPPDATIEGVYDWQEVIRAKKP